MVERDEEVFFWRMQGRQFGYPICCINHFVENASPTPEWAEYMDSNPLTGTGFVPCPNCKDKPVVVLSHIQVHRNKSLPPFPEHEGV